MECSMKIQLKKRKSLVALYFAWFSHIKLENTISAIEVGYSPLWTDFLWKVWKEVNLLLLFLPRDPYWWTRERNIELIPCTVFVNKTKRWVLFFSKPRFFLHFSSSNVVQSVWRAQGSIWRCSNRESSLIDKLFSIGPWYDFIEECEWAENSTTRDFERNCCHFPFYGFSFWIYWGQKKACKMGLSQMHPWIWFF